MLTKGFAADGKRPPPLPHPDPFEGLGIAPASASILRYFLIRPTARPHTREIQRVLNLGGASVQRELARFVRLGALRRSGEGRRVHYSIVPDSKLWTAFRILAEASADPATLIQNALCDVSGVEAAFLFGSAATRDQHADSDVDVFVVEAPTVDRRGLLRHLAEVGMLIGREVNTVRYSVHQLAERLGNPGHPGSRFVRDVLTGPKEWVAGTAEAIAPLAIAAGLRLRRSAETTS